MRRSFQQIANSQCPGSSQWQPVCLSLIELSSLYAFQASVRAKIRAEIIKKRLDTFIIWSFDADARATQQIQNRETMG